MGLDICHCILVEQTDELLDFHLIEDFEHNPSFLDNHREKIVHQDGNYSVYYKDIGYIRKQAESFTPDFENDLLYFKKDDVIRFKKYLKANLPAEQSDLENYFQINFINNFIEGESIFFISY